MRISDWSSDVCSSDLGWLHDNADMVRDLYGLPTSEALSLVKTFDIDEVTMSASVMADGELSIFGRPLRLEGGVRYVSVTTDSNFFDRYNDGALTRGGSNSSKFLPSFTSRFDTPPTLRHRLKRPNEPRLGQE